MGDESPAKYLSSLFMHESRLITHVRYNWTIYVRISPLLRMRLSASCDGGFFFYPTKGVGTQMKARIYKGRQPTQVEKEPAHTARKPAQAERSGVPSVRTLGR